MASASSVPYQAYKSKRHSRTISNPNLSPPRQTPSPTLAAPAVNGHARKSSDAYDAPTTEVISVNGTKSKPWPSSLDKGAFGDEMSGAKQVNAFIPLSQSNGVNGADSSSTDVPEPGPSHKPTVGHRRTSTIRFVSLRPPVTSTPRTSSPLRPTEGLPQVPTGELSPTTRHFDNFAIQTPKPGEEAPPKLPVKTHQSHHSLPAAHTLSFPQPPAEVNAPPDVTILPVQPVPSSTQSKTSSVPSSPSTRLGSPSPSSTPTHSTSLSVPTPTSLSAAVFKATYRPGFQPKGVYRPLTDEFMELRSKAHERGRVERTRLERRLEKLVNLHFSPEEEKQPEKVKRKENRRTSSLFDIDFNELRSRTPSELFKNVLENSALGKSGGKSDIRAAEQQITPWEPDSDVSACPHCSASFHPLTNRKHHCRLCGKIVCSLPTKKPQRLVPCSLLFVSDPKTGCIEEVSEGVDYGVRPRNSSTKNKGKPDDVEKFLKGVRICKDCKSTLQRRQYLQDSKQVPPFVRIYEAMTFLESQIEEALPQFHELIASLNINLEDAPSKEASAARKNLLASFAQYDALARRIRDIPCSGGPGSSQDRVQAAILTRASLFLQKNMFPLQSLPKPPKNPGITSGSETPVEPPIIDPDSQLAKALQPLLEQEALLESFIEEATAHRKFEDAKTLRVNLSEIRSEIGRMMNNAQVGNSLNGKSKAT